MHAPTTRCSRNIGMIGWGEPGNRGLLPRTASKTVAGADRQLKRTSIIMSGKEKQGSSLYDVLGVEPGASKAAIKKGG